MKTRLKIMTFNDRSLKSLQDKVNSFSNKNEVVDIQYNSNIDMLIGLQQNCAEARVLHTCVVVYKEVIENE